MKDNNRKIISFSGKNLFVTIADTDEKRQQGLMNVSSLQGNEGMLFIMKKNEPASFWMKNTIIPLDIAFIDQNMHIVKIASMMPNVGKQNSGNISVKYVVEAPLGWFNKNKIIAGQKMSFNNTPVQSSGLIILDHSHKTPRVLCVLSGFKQWDFPKGHQEKNETLVETAKREVAEETGLIPEDYRLTGEQAPPITYKSGNKLKTATYFIAERITNTHPTLPIDPKLGYSENIDWRWFEVSQLSNVMPKRFDPILIYLDSVCHDSHPELQR
jgi:uncharacterized membrane protein (UPF0127 family)/ADP-ribose pyrophosphatase YjhB (NUDIX family)